MILYHWLSILGEVQGDKWQSAFASPTNIEFPRRKTTVMQKQRLFSALSLGIVAAVFVGLTSGVTNNSSRVQAATEVATAPAMTSADIPGTGKITGPLDGEVNALNGAGATFPVPLYIKWFSEYKKVTGVKVNYQGIGSGGGIKGISD